MHQISQIWAYRYLCSVPEHFFNLEWYSYFRARWIKWKWAFRSCPSSATRRVKRVSKQDDAMTALPQLLGCSICLDLLVNPHISALVFQAEASLHECWMEQRGSLWETCPCRWFVRVLSTVDQIYLLSVERSLPSCNNSNQDQLLPVKRSESLLLPEAASLEDFGETEAKPRELVLPPILAATASSNESLLTSSLSIRNQEQQVENVTLSASSLVKVEYKKYSANTRSIKERLGGQDMNDSLDFIGSSPDLGSKSKQPDSTKNAQENEPGPAIHAFDK